MVRVPTYLRIYIYICMYTRAHYMHMRTQVDVYSFGIILWELGSRRPPFEGINPARVFKLVEKVCVCACSCLCVEKVCVCVHVLVYVWRRCVCTFSLVHLHRATDTGTFLLV